MIVYPESVKVRYMRREHPDSDKIDKLHNSHLQTLREVVNADDKTLSQMPLGRLDSARVV